MASCHSQGRHKNFERDFAAALGKCRWDLAQRADFYYYRRSMFAATHARSRKLGGGIQKVFQKALAATAHHGDRVVNASIGMALDDAGTLFTSAVLLEELRALAPAEVCAYSPIAGIPDFVLGTSRLFLGDNCTPLPASESPLGGTIVELQPSGHLACPIATVGGSSGLSLVLNNYLEKGAELLTSSYFWGPYETMADARGVRMAHFELFDSHDAFNVDAFAKGLRALQGETILALLNDPAQNPTGYCMTEGDWDRVCDVLDAETVKRKVVLLLDAAYLGYHRSFEHDRHIITRLLRYPWNDNLLLIIAGSCSKAFLSYGLRLGTCIGIHRDRHVLREFFNCLEFNIRGEYSNIARGAMRAVANICADPAKMERHLAEVARVRDTLAQRHRTWAGAAEGLQLRTTPYNAGYFLVVACPNPQEAAELLEDEMIFTVPIKQGLRIAICSVPSSKLVTLPPKIAEKTAIAAARA